MLCGFQAYGAVSPPRQVSLQREAPTRVWDSEDSLRSEAGKLIHTGDPTTP